MLRHRHEDESPRRELATGGLGLLTSDSAALLGWRAEEMTKEPHWTQLYRSHAQQIYETEAPVFRNDELTRQEIGILERVAESLELRVRSPVLDLACGPGRHSIELAARGYDVVGIDHSDGLLRNGLLAARRLSGKRPALPCGDVRALPFADRSFSTVFVLGKSFGFFSDAGNETALAEAARCLRPGGFLCLEIVDKEQYLSEFSAYEEAGVVGRNGDLLHSEWWSRWNSKSRRIEARERHSRLSTGEIVFEGPYELRLYDVDEIDRILRRIGFDDVIVLEEELSETFGLNNDVRVFGAAKRGG